MGWREVCIAQLVTDNRISSSALLGLFSIRIFKQFFNSGRYFIMIIIVNPVHCVTIFAALLCFTVSSKGGIKASQIIPTQSSPEISEVRIKKPGAVCTRVVPFFAENHKHGVGNFVEIIPPIAPIGQTISKKETSQAAKDTEKRMRNDVIYRLCIHALTFLACGVFGFLSYVPNVKSEPHGELAQEVPLAPPVTDTRVGSTALLGPFSYFYGGVLDSRFRPEDRKAPR